MARCYGCLPGGPLDPAPLVAPQRATRRTPTLEGSWLLGNLSDFRDNPLTVLQRAFREHGDFVRIRLFHEQILLVNTPGAIRQILVEKPERYTRLRNMEVPHFKTFLGEGLLTTEGQRWLEMRRTTQGGLHDRAVGLLAGRILEAAERSLGRMEGGERVDVFPMMMGMTASVTMQALMGYALGEAEERRFVASLIEGQDEVYHRMKYPIRVPEWVPTGRNRRFREVVRFMDGLLLTAAEGHPEGSGDLLGLFLESGKVTPTALRDQLVTMFVAAPESMGSTLTWTLHLLAGHPEVERRIRAEIAETLGERLPTPSDLPGLPFTRMVLEEAMRLYPAAPILDRRVVEDDEIDGHAVPAGTLVMMSPLLLHRHPALWDDPEAFRPERFAADAPRPVPFSYLPFGGGAHRCVGDRFALLALQVMLPMLLQRFSFIQAPGWKPGFEPRINLRPAGGMWMGVGRIGGQGSGGQGLAPP